MFNIDDIKEEVIEAAQDVITGRLFDEIDSEINSDAKVFKELALESVKFCTETNSVIWTMFDEGDDDDSSQYVSVQNLESDQEKVEFYRVFSLLKFYDHHIRGYPGEFDTAKYLVRIDTAGEQVVNQHNVTIITIR
jgi:hypothetical protein